MKAWDKVPKTIDEYIAAFDGEPRKRLINLRKTIAKHAAGATECISYHIPTFKLHGNLVHFAAYDKHIGFYPGAAPLVKFADELAGYVMGKGTVQFPHTQPIPMKLVETMVQYRVQTNLENAHLKKPRRTKEK